MKRLLFLTLMLSACATVPPQVAPLPAPVPIGPCLKNSWCYDSLVSAKITPVMLSAEPGDFCPKYSSVDHTKFWLKFVASIAFAESSWNPNEDYPETSMGIDPITGKQVVSSGLMQLSWQDRNNYPNAPTCQKLDYKANPKAIYDPAINLGCSMEIMDSLLKRYGGNIPSTLGKYWSSARVGHMASRNKLKQLMPECT